MGLRYEGVRRIDNAGARRVRCPARAVPGACARGVPDACGARRVGCPAREVRGVACRGCAWLWGVRLGVFKARARSYRDGRVGLLGV